MIAHSCFFDGTIRCLKAIFQEAKALAILRDKSCGLQVGLDHYILIDPLFQNLWENPEFRQIVRDRQAEKMAIREKIRKAVLKG